MRELAYVNGEFMDLADAVVPIEDRGFQFADGVYEVVVAYGGRPFRLTEHLERLRRSLDALGIDVSPNSLGLDKIIREGIVKCGFDPAMAYVQITRGTASRRHVVNHRITPTIVATFKKKPDVAEHLRRQGIRVMTMPDPRWDRCYIKSIALLPNVLARQEAMNAGLQDCIFVGPEGQVREATAANIFAFVGDTLITPPKDNHILYGVTRQYILECAERMGTPVKERTLSKDQLFAAEEVFISSTTIDLLPVVEIDGKPVSQGTPGARLTALHEEVIRGLR